MRMQSDVQNTGYAAGRAAAMSAKSGKPLRGIDVKELQRHLAAIGSIPQEALEWDDGFTVDAERWNLAVRNAGDGYKDVPLLLTDVDRALPPLRAAYTAETNPTRKLCYAHILGIMGDATGAETLARQIDGRDEPIKINVLEQTAYGRRMGERDALIVGLGRTKSPLAVEPLLHELEKINGTSSPKIGSCFGEGVDVAENGRTCPQRRTGDSSDGRFRRQSGIRPLPARTQCCAGLGRLRRLRRPWAEDI